MRAETEAKHCLVWPKLWTCVPGDSDFSAFYTSLQMISKALWVLSLQKNISRWEICNMESMNNKDWLFNGMKLMAWI